jgi:fibronectin type 3 domain-containing protein
VDGYKIFMANDPEHEFSVVKEMFGDSLITPGSRTIVRDTVMLNTLTRNVYYKIRAYDVHFNESEKSDVIALERPDIVPPPRPVFKNIETGSADIDFEIALPSVNDFQTATLYRSTGRDSDWQPVQVFREKTEVVRYVDRRLEPGATYFYRLQSEDQSGLLSDFSNPVQVRTVNRRSVSVAENLSAQYGDRGAVIRWAYPGDDLGEVFFVVYRRSGDRGFQQVGRSETTSFTDRRVRPGRYEYQVRVFRKDGNQSGMSESAAVLVRE